MLRPKRVKNGTTGAGRISSVVVVAWLIFGWSRPAFPDEQPHLQLAPIKLATTVGGDIGYTFLSNSLGTIKTTQQLLDVGVAVGVRAQSYLWQPWFARVTGALGIGVSANTASSSGSPTTKSGNTIITGDVALNVVQYSRFPFLAHAYRQNNQTSGFLSGINSNYLTNGLSLSQNYRSRDGKLDSQASYNHDTSGRASFGTEEAGNQLNFTLVTEPYSHQIFRVFGGMTGIDHPLKGDSSLVDTLVANHLFQPNSALSVGSFVNLIKTSDTIISPQRQNDYNSQQLSSFASWRPEGSPLTVTGSARLLRSNSSSTGVVTAPQPVDTNLNLGANYAWSPLLRMFGSVNVNDNGGIQTVSTNAALSAQRGFGERLDAINLGGFRYTRSVGASLSNQTTTTQNTTTNGPSQATTTSIQQLGGNLGHDLSKSTQLGSGRLMMDLNQGLSTILSTQASPITHLTSGGSLLWNHTEGSGTTMLGLRAVDSRDLSGTHNFFQLINLQASRNEHVGRNQSLIGNLTMQASRSGANGVSTPFIASPSADLTYRHQRLFQVKNLTFESILKIVGADIVSSQNLATQQNLSTQNQARASWDNNLDYFIGRLRMRLYTHIAEVDKVTQSSIFFNMVRSF
jgi:hypothetical protein